MSVLVVPAMEAEGQEWPSLGGQVIAWIEGNLVFGPGDLRGQPAKLDEEKRALLWRMYEVYPRDHEHAGRRRFKRVALSLRKGSAKTELAAMIAAAELHPAAPVRCVGWVASACPVHGKVRRKGEPATCRCLPRGGAVRDPFIPLLAYTEEQSEELCYGALKVILELSKVAGDFDIGLERIMRIGGDGKALAVANAPGPRDGARTTFQVGDETHRLTLPRQRKAWQTMLANQPKRRLSDAWALETTTAYSPGEQSVAESTMHYAQAVAEGRQKDSRLFFFHRQASDSHDLATAEGVRAAVLEASGPVAPWSDIESIVAQWDDPTNDRTFLERVWLNRIVRSSDRAFNVEIWRKLHRKNHKVAKRAKVTLGFDGARTFDSCALVGTEIATGYQFRLGLWARPLNLKREEQWEAPVDEINEAVDEAMKTYDVWRFYVDPPYWETVAAEWAGKYGEDRVVFWFTYRQRPMSRAVKAFANAIAGGELEHDGDVDYAAHVGNTFRRTLQIRDEDEQPLWTIQKERPDSPLKIDMAVAGVLSWAARTDALAAGIGAPKKKSVYEERGLITL